MGLSCGSQAVKAGVAALLQFRI